MSAVLKEAVKIRPMKDDDVALVLAAEESAYEFPGVKQSSRTVCVLVIIAGFWNTMDLLLHMP